MNIDAALSRRLLALCLHLCGNAADAEDALQETLLALHVARFRGESSVETFAYRVALRIALRIKSRRRPAGELAGEPAVSRAGAGHAGGGPGPGLRAPAPEPAPAQRRPLASRP